MNDAKIAGYFFALVVLIIVPPGILLGIGRLRRWKLRDSRIEVKLSCAARQYINENRVHAMCSFFHENEKSWKNRTVSFMQNPMRSQSTEHIESTSTTERDAPLEFFQHELKQCNTFWGERNLVF